MKRFSLGLLGIIALGGAAYLGKGLIDHLLRGTRPGGLGMLAGLAAGLLALLGFTLLDHVVGKPAVKSPPDPLQAALLKAACEDDIEKARSVLEAGTNIEASDSDGSTALMMAAQKGNLKLMIMLMEKGADVNAIGKTYTPLLAAVEGIALGSPSEGAGDLPVRRPAGATTMVQTLLGIC